MDKEQERLAYSDILGTNIIRGIAGSGKTTIGIERAKYLLEKCCMKEEKILFVTYNKSLSQYLKHLYKSIEKIQGINLFNDLETGKEVVFKTIDSLMYFSFMSYCKKNNYSLTIEWNPTYEVLKSSIEKIQAKYSGISIISKENIKFIQDEIKWIKGSDYMNLDTYQNVDRVGRGSNNGEGPSRLYKNSESRKAIFELMIEIDKMMLEDFKVDGGTANILALRHIISNPELLKYKHILVDEAQDLTKVQIKFLKVIFGQKQDGSLLFLMDAAQSIYPQAWLGKGNSFKSAGIDMSGKGAKLTKNYRTTTEISKSAYSLLSKEIDIVEDDNFVRPSLLDRHGDFPIYRNFSNAQMQNMYVVKQIKQLTKEGYKLSDIAVVSKINKNLEIINKILHENKIDTFLCSGNTIVDFQLDKVKLLTMHSIKGLEFKVVILVDLNSNIIPYVKDDWNEEQRQIEEITERKLLYVGMTRAQQKLFMCSYGAESKFIDDIDKNFLIMQSGCRMSAYYPVQYSEYICKNKVKDETSEEESVRQWVIKEIKSTYGYPLELIELEYPVKLFSQNGRVDLVIKNGVTNEPYICIETKKRDVDIKEATSQLKSYMQVTGAKYGIATNGANIAFIDSDYNYIKDIPKCSINILPSSTQKYRVICPHTFSEQVFEVDLSAREVIINNKNLLQNETTKLKVYSDIAAGLPIEIIDDEKGEFIIPTSILNNNKNLFMLKVKGDSMVGAGIDDEDYVIIEQTSTVGNNQIAAVEYNGGATLKRVVRMGSTILLMSENEAYEPINISEGDLKIAGKLVSIIKK